MTPTIPRLHLSRPRRGAILMYVIVSLVALLGFCSLAVDWGRVQVAKTELRRVADAAARAGARLALTNSAQGRADAIAVAASNTVDGSSYTLPSADVEFGNWSNNTFTLNGTPTNACRVSVERSTARGNAIPLMLGQIIGKNTCDIHATAIGKCDAGTVGGFIGLTSLSVGSNCLIASYNSAVDTSPNNSSYYQHGIFASNGSVKGQTNDSLYGTIILGPGATTSGFTIYGSTVNLTKPITAPTLPTWSPSANPGGVPASYTVSSNTTLPGGNYWFTSLTVTGSTLNFSGPATLYVNGNIKIDGSLLASGLIPSNLTIYQYGANTFTDGNNNCNVCAVIVAPQATYSVSNSSQFRGGAVFNIFKAKNYSNFYYDEALGPGTGSPIVQLVK